MVTIFGWLRADAERASCSKRCNRSLCAESAEGRILIATLRSRRRSRARYTSPIPPAPSGSMISYGPSLVPEVRAISHVIIFPKETGISCLMRTAALFHREIGALCSWFENAWSGDHFVWPHHFIVFVFQDVAVPDVTKAWKSRKAGKYGDNFKITRANAGGGWRAGY